jgi:polyphosphate glucokinase
MAKIALGIDVGGSGIKGAPVNTKTGRLEGDRLRIPTPAPATPDLVIAIIAEIVASFKWKGPLGIGFPAAIRQGVALTAANIDPAWIDCDVARLVKKNTGCPTIVLNDADAAGLAACRYERQANKGVVLFVTIGTGLGTALFVDGVLVPNMELGHLLLDGHGIAEHYASDAARDRENLDWSTWATRFDQYLKHLERLCWPDLILLGGGISKKGEKFLPRLTVKTPVRTTSLRNEAGIIGAALAAAEMKN